MSCRDEGDLEDSVQVSKNWFIVGLNGWVLLLRSFEFTVNLSFTLILLKFNVGSTNNRLQKTQIMTPLWANSAQAYQKEDIYKAEIVTFLL